MILLLFLEKESNEENKLPIIEFDEEPLLIEEKKVKHKRKSTRKISALANVSNNFVRINLRRKTYAHKSRTNFKKKWKKLKFSKQK